MKSAVCSSPYSDEYLHILDLKPCINCVLWPILVGIISWESSLNALSYCSCYYNLSKSILIFKLLVTPLNIFLKSVNYCGELLTFCFLLSTNSTFAPFRVLGSSDDIPQVANSTFVQFRVLGSSDDIPQVANVPFETQSETYDNIQQWYSDVHM